MFGLCVLNKKLILFLLVLFFPLLGFSQAQQATVIEEGALVYQDADFDAPVITTLKRGSVYSISKTTKGPFYKIRIKPGMLGWISDVDVRPGVHKLNSAAAQELPEEIKKEEENRPKKPFFATRYRGLALDYINFVEETLGQERSEGLLFYGVKFNGFDTLVSGEIYTESNILLHLGPPSYYDLTGKASEGFIFIADFLLQTVIPQGKNRLLFYGFGPILKYSHFNLALPNGANTLNYVADDMSLGAVFNLGYSLRFGKFSVRADAKYYWEKAKYYGFGLNLGREF